MVELAIEIHERFRPQQPQHVDLLLEQPCSSAEVHTETFVFREVPTDADGRTDPTAGQQIQRRDLFGGQRGLTLRQHEHAGDELETFGDRSEVGEERQDLVERVLIGVRRAVERPERSGTEPLGAGPEDVVVGQHVVETCVLRATNPIAQRVGVGTAVGL